MVLAHPTLPHPPPSNKSVTRLVPTPLCGRRRPPGPARRRQARGQAAPRLHVRPRGRLRGGCARGRERRPRARARPPPAQRPPAPGGSIPAPRGPGRRTPPQLHIPPRGQTDSRPRPRDGAENHGVSRPARPRLRRGGCGGPRAAPAPPSPGPGDGGRRPTLTHREPEPASALPAPAPALPRRRRRGQAGPARGGTLTSTSRPLFLKLLMRWFSRPGFSAMAARGSGGGYSCGGGGGGGEPQCGRGRRGSAGGRGRGRGGGEHVP